jgi:biotin carboxyl carrier protein
VLYEIQVGGKSHRLELKETDAGWHCVLDGKEVPVDAAQTDCHTMSLLIGNESFEVRREPDGKLFIRGVRYETSVEDPRSWRGKRRRAGATEGPQKLTASMPGKIVRVLAHEGDKISAGQGIAVIEAMKMQNEIKSPKEGTLKKLLVHAGVNVNAGEVLAIVE